MKPALNRSLTRALLYLWRVLVVALVNAIMLVMLLNVPL